jgi:hypothetical protein
MSFARWMRAPPKSTNSGAVTRPRSARSVRRVIVSDTRLCEQQHPTPMPRKHASTTRLLTYAKMRISVEIHRISASSRKRIKKLTRKSSAFRPGRLAALTFLASLLRNSQIPRTAYPSCPEVFRLLLQNLTQDRLECIGHKLMTSRVRMNHIGK